MKKKGLSFIQLLIPPQSIQFILAVYVVSILFFAFFRVLFQFQYAEQFYPEMSWVEILYSYFIGIRFDQIIILGLLAPLLLLLPFLMLGNRFSRYFSLGYLSIVFSLSFLIHLIDIRFYDYFNSRLNFLAYEYYNEGSFTSNLVSADPYYYSYIFLWILISILFAFIISIVYKSRALREVKTTRLKQIIWTLVILLGFTVGIRGRVSLAPMDWGIAYFSSNHTLNQSALNGIYTLGKNYFEKAHDPRLSALDEEDRFPFIDEKEALRQVQRLLVQPNEQLLDPAHSLARSVSASSRSFNPNIVLVVMEGWMGNRTSCLGDNRGLTPHFDSLAQEGMLFNNFYANGFRTNFGLAAILCSYPALPGRSIMKRFESEHPFISLSEILLNRGYNNTFMYGGDIAFDNMEGFFRTKGYDRFYSEDDFSADKFFSKWGVPDHLLFERVVTIMDSLPRPFQLTALTLSNHEPFDLPDSSFRRYSDKSDTSKMINALVYADYSIGYFMKLAKKLPVFDSTIFVFVSDHSRLESTNMYLHPKIFRVPLLIYAPAVLGDSSVVVSTYGSQVDILPTLMGILGGDYIHESWGRNLLTVPDNDKGFAFLNLWERIGYLDDAFYYFEQVGQFEKFYKNDSGNYLELAPDSVSEQFKIRQERLRVLSQLADQMTIPASK